eukprot:FR740007.1.p1 GENE.FR740007.1~~FR740007.1.p1  ORF type:complete len:337 (+),score=38.86 FR740007.1:50-1012(+)
MLFNQQKEQTSMWWGMGIVSLVIVAVGLFLFLLPPVPGVPIYLTGGIILIATGTNYQDHPKWMPDGQTDTFMAIIPSICWCCGLSLVIKLTACTIQQMGIGKNLKRSVRIRQMVGVNSHMTRSMKIVLRRPGLDIAKVAILVGGPDWPTSVLCGIMDLDLLPVLFGTLPVSFLIFPTILAGTFLYLGQLKDDETDEYPFSWCQTAAVVFVMLAAIVQTGSMFIAAYYLEKAVNESGDELDAMPYDKEVSQADALNKAKTDRYYHVRKWKSLPLYGRVILILQVVMMTFWRWVSMLFPSDCFRDFCVTDSFNQELETLRLP